MKKIKIIEKIGKQKGKTTVLIAGIHGNEICGVRAFDSLIPKLDIRKGKVIFIYANLKAIRKDKRFIEYNLNRCFLKKQPRKISRTLEGKTAKEIMFYLIKADAMLDIHASFTKNSKPFLICDKKQIKKGEIFNTNLISYNWDKFEPGSTDYFMNIQNKPGFCYESGYLKDLKSKKRAERAIINFLRFMKNIPGKLNIKTKPRFIKIKSLYINKKGKFIRKKYLPDFFKINKTQVIGIEDNKRVYAYKGDIILFLRSSKNLNEECFLIGEETYLNQKNLQKLAKRRKA